MNSSSINSGKITNNLPEPFLRKLFIAEIASVAIFVSRDVAPC